MKSARAHNDTPTANIAEELRGFAYKVSHDLGAPARAMIEFSKLLQDESSQHLSGDAQEYLSLIIHNGKRMQMMMAALLAYSRIEDHPVKRKIDCTALFEQCVAARKDRINQTHADISYGALPTLDGNPEQLSQLMLALLDNALTFVHPDRAPRIHFSARKQGREWQFTMEDNGIGLAKEHQQKIFDMFVCLHGEEDYPGVGAGLTISQKIVRAHGGTITATPSDAQGCRVIFTLVEH